MEIAIFAGSLLIAGYILYSTLKENEHELKKEELIVKSEKEDMNVELTRYDDNVERVGNNFKVKIPSRRYDSFEQKTSNKPYHSKPSHTLLSMEMMNLGEEKNHPESNLHFHAETMEHVLTTQQNNLLENR